MIETISTLLPTTLAKILGVILSGIALGGTAILYETAKGIFRRLLVKQYEPIRDMLTVGKFDMNVQEWFSFKRRPYRKYAKRIARWMRK